MSDIKHEGRPYGTTSTPTNPSIHHQYIATTDNRADRCLDCDSERLARGYHRCAKCLVALRDGLRRRHAADIRLARWHS
jgi:hypothetical protein